jgi:predicted patatin/cPLA2 family phospholipase
MRFEGDPEVLCNLFQRQCFIKSGSPRQRDINPIVFVSTGVRRGVISAGMGRPLERHGLHRACTHLIGSSTGAASGQFGISGQIAQCIDLYWNEAASKEFISLARVMSGKSPVQNTRYLCDAFRRRLDLAAFHSNPAHFWTCATCAETGEGVLLDAKRKDIHPVDAVMPSMSIPGLCGGPVIFEGRALYDGAGAMGMPTREIIEKFGPTDLLVFANCPDEKKGSWMTSLMEAGLMRNENEAVQHAFRTRYARFADRVRYLRSEAKCRWAILWTDNSIGQYERDPWRLQDAANRADAFMSDLLAKAKAKVWRELEIAAA